MLHDFRNAVDSARRCQRNWDLSRSVPEEHIHDLEYIATHAPSKQDESFFDLYILTDRDKIDFLAREHSWGFTMFPNAKDWVARNPQMGANVLFVYNARMDMQEVRNNHKDGSTRDPHAKSRWDNAYASIGISSGMVALTANMMGYKTGYSKNFGYKEEPVNSDDAWGEILGLDKADNNLIYSLGIGYSREELNWNESFDNNEFLSGGPINYETRTMPTNIKYSKYSTTQRKIKVHRI